MAGPGSETVVVNGSGVGPPEDAVDSDTDSSHSIYSVTSEEIQDTFIERHGRYFHSHGNGVIGPYPFPVDEQEKARMDEVHDLLKHILNGRNYVGPVDEILRQPRSHRHPRKRVLDICTGTGRWVDEMAAEFPEAKIYGLDIAPIVNRYPNENAQFEIHDMNESTRWRAGRFDLVHVRQVSLCVRNYEAILVEVSRILHPRGLFISGEWTHEVIHDDDSEANDLVPGVARFLNRLFELLRRLGIQRVSARIPQILVSSGRFEDVTPALIRVPLDRSEVGRRAKRMVSDFCNSARAVFLEANYSGARVDELLQAVQNDLENDSGLYIKYQTVHARRNTVP